MKYYSQLRKSVGLLHESGLIHGHLDPNSIVQFSRDETGTVLDPSDYTKEKEVKKMKISKDYRYSSPEVIQNIRKLRKEDDYWSMGMILLEMCLGDIPFDVEEYFKITKEKIEKLLKERNYSQETVDIIINLIINRKITTQKEENLVNKRNRSMFKGRINKNHLKSINLSSKLIYTAK